MKNSASARQVIRARELRAFLLDLKKRHHHIFALLSHVPRVVFRILVDDVSKQSPDKMTIPEFLKTYRTCIINYEPYSGYRC